MCQAKTEILALTPATGTSLASFRNVQNHQRHDDDALMLFLDITAAKWLQSDLSFYDAAMCAKPNHRTTAKVYVSGRMVERWPLGDDLGWCWYVGTRKIWDMNEAKGLCVWKVVSGVANLKQCFFFNWATHWGKALENKHSSTTIHRFSKEHVKWLCNLSCFARFT